MTANLHDLLSENKFPSFVGRQMAMIMWSETEYIFKVVTPVTRRMAMIYAVRKPALLS